MVLASLCGKAILAILMEGRYRGTKPKPERGDVEDARDVDNMRPVKDGERGEGLLQGDACLCETLMAT